MTLRKALVVDDNPANLLIARISLERIGQLEVVTAGSGAEALLLAAAEAPDVILLDVAMPELDGLEVLAMLRGRADLATIPVIFLTARAMRHEVDDLIAAGAAGVILKPFEPLRLPEEVRRLVAEASRPALAQGSVGSVAINAALVAAGRSPIVRPADDTPTQRIAIRTAPRRRILSIDDEALCGAMIQRALRRSHDVAITTSGAEALSWIAAGQRWDVILCDLSMPAVSGEDVFARLTDECPDQAARLTIVTAGATTTSAARFLTRMAGRVLWKPFDQGALLAFVDRVLVASSGDADAPVVEA